MTVIILWNGGSRRFSSIKGVYLNKVLEMVDTEGDGYDTTCLHLAHFILMLFCTGRLLDGTN